MQVMNGMECSGKEVMHAALPITSVPPALTRSTRSSLRMTRMARGMDPTPNTCVLS